MELMSSPIPPPSREVMHMRATTSEIGNRVLHFLSQETARLHGATVSEILEAVPEARNKVTLFGHLNLLEEAGAIVGRPAPGVRHRKTVTYKVDWDAIDRLHAVSRAYQKGQIDLAEPPRAI
ncbi:hypothetical protein C5E14_11260 [Rathayibacter sp. AY1A1]|nr:hypothetical protein C5E14_11260 [Rathayibacter sp. AY1A1]